MGQIPFCFLPGEASQEPTEARAHTPKHRDMGGHLPGEAEAMSI